LRADGSSQPGAGSAQLTLDRLFGANSLTAAASRRLIAVTALAAVLGIGLADPPLMHAARAGQDNRDVATDKLDAPPSPGATAIADSADDKGPPADASGSAGHGSSGDKSGAGDTDAAGGAGSGGSGGNGGGDHGGSGDKGDDR
jgi:hypothetical protein